MLLRKRPEREELSKKLPIRKSKVKKENSQEKNDSKKLDIKKEPLSSGNGTKVVENQDEGEGLELSSDENKPKKKRRRRVLSWSHKKRKKHVYINEGRSSPLYTGPVECSLKDVLETLNTLTDEEKQLPSECSLIYECKKCSEFFRDLEEFFKHKSESCASVEQNPIAVKTESIVSDSRNKSIENFEFSNSNNKLECEIVSEKIENVPRTPPSITRSYTEIAVEIRSRLQSLQDSNLFFGPVRKRRKLEVVKDEKIVNFESVTLKECKENGEIFNNQTAKLLNLIENVDPTSPSTSGISKSA